MHHLSSLIVSFCSVFLTKRINIELKRKDEDYFLSSKNNHFILENKTVNLSANHWYLIKLQLTMQEEKTTLSRFHLDYGPGFDTENILELPIESGIENTTILFTKHLPTQIKFEALCSEDDPEYKPKDWFQVNSLQFIPINPFFAKRYMMDALHRQQPNLPAKALNNEVSTQAAKLNISFINSLLLSYKKTQRKAPEKT